MARVSDSNERIAKLEAHVENLKLGQADIRADLKQTVQEMAQALEKHEGEHKAKATEAAGTRWKVISAILGTATIVAPIVTFFIVRES